MIRIWQIVQVTLRSGVGGGKRQAVGETAWSEAVRRSGAANDRRKQTQLRFFQAQERAGAEQSKRKGGRDRFAAWSACWFQRIIHELMATFARKFNESEDGQ